MTSKETEEILKHTNDVKDELQKLKRRKHKDYKNIILFLEGLDIEYYIRETRAHKKYHSGCRWMVHYPEE
jgi:hypothetical protein